MNLISLIVAIRVFRVAAGQGKAMLVIGAVKTIGVWPPASHSTCLPQRHCPVRI
jgi:hypothetical protein